MPLANRSLSSALSTGSHYPSNSTAASSNSRFGNFAQAHRPKRADAGAKNDQHRPFCGSAAL